MTRAFGCDISKPERLSKHLPKGVKAKCTDSALAVMSAWCQDDYMVSSINQLRWKRGGWWRLALHLSCAFEIQQTTDPPWHPSKPRYYEWGTLIFKRLFSSKVTFWQHSGESVPKSNYRLLRVRRDEEVTAHELSQSNDFMSSQPRSFQNKDYLPVKTSTPEGLWKDGAGGSFKHQLSPRNCAQCGSRAGFTCPCMSTRWQSMPCWEPANSISGMHEFSSFKTKGWQQDFFPQTAMKKEGLGGRLSWVLVIFSSFNCQIVTGVPCNLLLKCYW